MTETTIFLLTGYPRSGKTTSAAIMTRLLHPYRGRFAAILPGGINHTIDRIFSAEGNTPWVVDGWQTYEEAIALKASTTGRLITIEIAHTGTRPIELPMARTSHVIKNNGTIADLETQLAAMLRQYYPTVGSG